MTNREDNCTGRFWEGRFRSQALLDEAVLISCMAYVDLNSARANTCTTLEQSEITSIQERLRAFSEKRKEGNSSWLASISSDKVHSTGMLPVCQMDYLALVDWTGRAIREGKRGAIPHTIQPILHPLDVEESIWIKNTQFFGRRFRRVIGRIDQIYALADRIDQQWLTGLEEAKAFSR